MSSIHMLMSSFIMSSLCFTDCIWIEGVGAGWASATSMATSGADCWMGSRNAMEERLSRFVPGRWDTYLEPSRSAFGLHRAGSSVPQSSQPHPEGSNGRNAAWRLCILNSAEILKCVDFEQVPNAPCLCLATKAQGKAFERTALCDPEVCAWFWFLV